MIWMHRYLSGVVDITKGDDTYILILHIWEARSLEATLFANCVYNVEVP